MLSECFYVFMNELLETVSYFVCLMLRILDYDVCVYRGRGRKRDNLPITNHIRLINIKMENSAKSEGWNSKIGFKNINKRIQNGTSVQTLPCS